jgi:hypothetical protein
LHKNLTCDKWSKAGSTKQTATEERLHIMHGGKKIEDFNTQKKLYWLYVDQVIPPTHNFRHMIEESYEPDWSKIDGKQLFTQSRLASFQWRGYHGKLYARRDLLRFGYTTDSKCNYCEVNVQTVHPLFVDCPRTLLLYKNLEAIQA